MSDDTVKLHLIINIQVDDPEADTRISVDEWNAMDDLARSETVRWIWDTYAQQDSGGVSVVTAGAEGL